MARGRRWKTARCMVAPKLYCRRTGTHSVVLARQAGENQTVRLRLLATPGAHHWYADGRYLGLKDGDAWIELGKGRHRLLAVPAKDGGAGEAVDVLVK